MKLGTKSVLYGAHCWCIHPWFVALGWYKLYGFPWDPRLWLCFFVHDLGYIGKPNMDGPEGELHPFFGASIVRRWFGEEWGDFCLLHSRFLSRRLGRQYSRLCIADKMAIVVTPSWFYLPFVWATGELSEYMALEREAKYLDSGFDHSNAWAWHQSVKRYIQAWVNEHKDVDRPDGWIGGNGADIRVVPQSTLPGYLEGGYEHNKYIILKKDGTPVNPDARYMVVRYDKDRDPHGIFSTIAYACSVTGANKELSVGIFRAVSTELGMTLEEFYRRYDRTIDLLYAARQAFCDAGALKTV